MTALFGASLLQHLVKTGAVVLQQWEAARQALPGWALPTAPGRGAEDMDVCYQILQAASGRTNEQPSREMAEQAHFYCRWASFNFPVLSLTESLSAALVLTDPGSVSGDTLRLPFDSFMVELPWPRTPLTMTTFEGKPTGVRWIQVHQVDLIAEAADRKRIEQLWKSEAVSPGELRQIEAAMPRSPTLIIRLSADNGISVYESIPAPTTKPLRQWLKAEYSDRETGTQTTRQDRVAIKSARAFIANLCLYMAELSRERQSRVRPSSRATTRHHREKPAPTRWVLGREVKLGAELRDAARRFTERGSHHEWKLQARFVVRGHWRNQACGIQLQDRRRRWIEPHWKGPTTSPGLVRPIRVGSG